MKGILLAGGTGTRLHPLTISMNKHLLPIADSPMFYYPLETLMQLGCDDIMIITRPQDQGLFRRHFRLGDDLGIKLQYRTQEKPRGIAEAFIIAEDWLEDEPVMLILGDNIFWGIDTADLNFHAEDLMTKAHIFLYKVKDPERYGVATIDGRKVINIEEKPEQPESDLAVVGLYYYPPGVAEKTKSLSPSGRNELEITDLNRLYMEEGNLTCDIFKNVAWLDTGTHASMHEASSFIHAIQDRTGVSVGDPKSARK
jgi:glucose-1-phosphate thymidylyltransferase